MTGCHYNVDRLSLLQKKEMSEIRFVISTEGRWNYADRAVSAASEREN